MRFAGSVVETFAEDAAAMYNDGSDHRVGACSEFAAAGELDGASHPIFIGIKLCHIRKLLYFCSMKESYDQMYQRARRTFSACYDASEASAMAFALLEDRYGVSRTDVLRGKDTDFSAEERNEFEEILQKIVSGVPLQHATGRALFCGRYFKVTPDTLIPRPETEGLASHNPLLSRKEGAVRVLDCGTGSGCIAITIALDHPDWEVEAWDISEGALAVAKENAEVLGAKNVTFQRKDILAEAEAAKESLPSSLQPLTLIISNPPYICRREAAEMEAHVLDHEPHTALFVPDDDPLLFYRALAEIGRARLVPGGYIVVECNRAYTQETAALFENYGFVDVEIINDCFDAPRFVRARKHYN